MRDKNIQSLTAYTCSVCRRYHTDNLLVRSEDNLEPIDLESLLNDFFRHIKKCKIDRYTSRALLLNENPQRDILESSVVRLHIQPDAGKALENFAVVNYHTNEIKGYKGDNYSAVYNYNILFYINGEENVFVFHHYGHSGCKTAFLNMFNEFLAAKGLIAHLAVLMSKSMFDNINKCVPEKISLISTYSDLSSDKADNIGNKERKKIEQEVIISLDAPRATNIREWFKRIFSKEPSIEELKTILLEDDYPTEFEEAKITMKFGKVRRRINLREFTGVIAEYDITDKLEMHVDGSVLIESLYAVADEYAIQFLK